MGIPVRELKEKLVEGCDYQPLAKHQKLAYKQAVKSLEKNPYGDKADAAITKCTGKALAIKQIINNDLRYLFAGVPDQIKTLNDNYKDPISALGALVQYLEEVITTPLYDQLDRLKLGDVSSEASSFIKDSIEKLELTVGGLETAILESALTYKTLINKYLIENKDLNTLLKKSKAEGLALIDSMSSLPQLLFTLWLDFLKTGSLKTLSELVVDKLSGEDLTNCERFIKENYNSNILNFSNNKIFFDEEKVNSFIEHFRQAIVPHIKNNLKQINKNIVDECPAKYIDLELNYKRKISYEKLIFKFFVDVLEPVLKAKHASPQLQAHQTLP